MKVREAMTGNVECIAPTANMREAAEKMKTLEIGFLPVCENEKLVGTITDRDIVVRVVANGLDAASNRVRDFMTLGIVYRFEDEDVQDVGRYMQEKEVKRMLVLSRDHKLVGVLSIGDLSKITGQQELAGETLRQISEAA